MMRHVFSGALALAVVAPVTADVWDHGDEGQLETRNDLVHGSWQIHDLGPGPVNFIDFDRYRVGATAHRSYEIIVDGLTGDLDLGTDSLQRGAADGNHLAVPVTGHERTLRLSRASGRDELETIFVGIAGCRGSCDLSDQYHIRLLETTVAVARFNNAGSQRSILLVQNGASRPAAGTAYFWSADGALLHTHAFDLPARGLEALTLAAAAPLAGKGGSITIAHDAPYGLLNAKAIAVEPTTGFSFDSPGTVRGH